MKKGHHAILDSDRPLEQLWDIAKKYGATRAIGRWIENYTESAHVEFRVSHELLESIEDKKDYLAHVEERSLRELGYGAAEIAHTWNEDRYLDVPWTSKEFAHEDRYKFSMLVILPRKKENPSGFERSEKT